MHAAGAVEWVMATRKHSLEDYVVDGVNFILLTIILIVTLYPFYYIFINSLNEGLDATLGGIYLWPRAFTFENYTMFFSDPKWLNSLAVTVARTITGTLLSVFFTCLVAYALSRRELVGRRIYFSLLVFAMYISGGLIPYYVVLRSLRLLDTFWVYIVPPTLNIFFTLVATAFFRDIPNELIEFARLDGANDLTIYVRIVLPISKPLIATMLLFLGVQHWNSWLDSAYFVRSATLRTLSYRMMEVINQSFAPSDIEAAMYADRGTRATSLSLQLAAMIVATVPIICVYPFLQKHFVKGIMLGAVKG